MRKVVIVGGGLAGLVCGIQLAKAGIHSTLIEKKSYPFHRVCGEYISNEAFPFLKSGQLFPADFSPPQMSRFQLSSVSGRLVTIPLDLGGFGISRYTFDNFLFQKATHLGIEVLLNEEVTGVAFDVEKFIVETDRQAFESDVVIGGFGKRSKLDVSMSRDFIKRRSPYAAIKYHIQTDHPRDVIALHNFNGGYCGVSSIENGLTNLCYLTHRDLLRKNGSVKNLETRQLFRNPLLKSLFENSDFVSEKPEVINEISFEIKQPVENHILMVGDAAGMIAPLCGNGMAMAIHSGKMAAELVARYCSGQITRKELESAYIATWNQIFRNRLWTGRQIQRVFGNKVLSQIAVGLVLNSRPVANAIIRRTHGEAFF